MHFFIFIDIRVSIYSNLLLRFQANLKDRSLTYNDNELIRTNKMHRWIPAIILW